MLGDSIRRTLGPVKRRLPPASRRVLPAWSWKRWVPLLIAAAITPFVVGYAIAVFVLFPAPPVAEPGIPVPDLVGMSSAEAQRTLVNAQLGTLEVTELPHPDRPAGIVIAQSPLPGQQLRVGSPVRVAVSSGVPRAMVPDVTGFAFERAERLLRRLGFEVERIEEITYLSPSGRVLRTDPVAGSDRALPDTVRVYVGIEDPLLRRDTTATGG